MPILCAEERIECAAHQRPRKIKWASMLVIHQTHHTRQINQIHPDSLVSWRK